MKYTDTFSNVAALSSALVLDGEMDATDDAPALFMRKSYCESVFGDLTQLMGSDMDPYGLVQILKESQTPFPNLYIYCGTEDTLIQSNRDYHQYLNANDVQHTYVEGLGIHDWVFWDAYI